MSADGTAGWVEAPADDWADAMVASLSAGGIDHLFFTSGSEIGFYQEAIAKAKAKGHNNPIRLITVPLEHVSLNAALGYAAVSGRPAATAAHVDCGTQHYGGAIHTAWRSGLPVVITSGYPPTAYAGTMHGARDEGGHIWMQEGYDQNGIMRSYTKWNHRLVWQDNPGLVMSRAIQVARTEPAGPVYVNVAKELVVLPLREPRFPSADQLGIPRPTALDPEVAHEIAEKLVKAKNPFVVVGWSGRNPATVPALVELCEMLGIGVVDAVQRGYLCFPMRHPLCQMGPALTGADAVLVLEAEVPWVPTRNAPPPDAYVAAIAQDPIKMRVPQYEFTANVRAAADPLLAIRAIAAAAKGMLKADDKARIAARTKALAEGSKKWIAAAEKEATDHAKDVPMHPMWVSYQLGKLIDDNCIVIDETLRTPRVREFMPCARPGSYFSNPGSSGGWSPGAALGAKIAAPDRDVIAVTGDGFYMFGTPAPAIWAAKHHNAPFMAVVYTNRSYSTGTTRVGEMYQGGYAAKSGFVGGYFDPPIDFAKEAEAAGAYGETVRDPADVLPALKRGLEQIRSGKPAVISMWLQRLVDGK
ncbi:MAG TPA: thiamine pyrophosphate-requiring protein [Propylenella sp.]